MEAVNILHMNSADGESSYANNSLIQNNLIRKSLPILEHTIKSMVSHDIIFGQYFKIADLGCSSGPNTLFTASSIMDIVQEAFKESNRKTPDFQVCLNDLFGNDFNSIFESLPNFYAKLKKEKGESFGCYVSAVPGSFYDRLFPDESLHFVHSSNSIHWLSQVPESLENNTSHIYMGKKSPQNVFQAYHKQYVSDFTRFLQMRSKEIVIGGRMVLTFAGRSISDPTYDDYTGWWPLLIAESLLDLVKEGLVKQSDFNSFNIPYYSPCEDEVRDVVQNEGSFSIDIISGFEVKSDLYDTDYKNTKASHELSPSHGENTMKIEKAARAVVEPLLASHFGSSIMDKLFKIYVKRVCEHIVVKKIRNFGLAVSLTKN